MQMKLSLLNVIIVSKFGIKVSFKLNKIFLLIMLKNIFFYLIDVLLSRDDYESYTP